MTEQITPEYLSFATEHHASDIFIIAGRPLSFKINGKLSIYGERLMPADTESCYGRFIRCPTTVTLTVFWKSEMMTFLFPSPDFPVFVLIPTAKEVLLLQLSG